MIFLCLKAQAQIQIAYASNDLDYDLKVYMDSVGRSSLNNQAVTALRNLFSALKYANEDSYYTNLGITQYNIWDSIDVLYLMYVDSTVSQWNIKPSTAKLTFSNGVSITNTNGYSSGNFAGAPYAKSGYLYRRYGYVGTYGIGGNGFQYRISFGNILTAVTIGRQSNAYAFAYSRNRVTTGTITDGTADTSMLAVRRKDNGNLDVWIKGVKSTISSSSETSFVSAGLQISGFGTSPSNAWAGQIGAVVCAKILSDAQITYLHAILKRFQINIGRAYTVNF